MLETAEQDRAKHSVKLEKPCGKSEDMITLAEMIGISEKQEQQKLAEKVFQEQQLLQAKLWNYLGPEKQA